MSETERLAALLAGVVDAYDACDGNRGAFSCHDPHDCRCPKSRSPDGPSGWRGEWVCACGRERLDAALDKARAVLGAAPAEQPESVSRTSAQANVTDLANSDRRLASDLGAAPADEMAAFDRAEFNELLKEVVALREWKAAQEAVVFQRAAPADAPERLSSVALHQQQLARRIEIEQERAVSEPNEEKP